MSDDMVMVSRQELENVQGMIRNLTMSALEDNDMEAYNDLAVVDAAAHALASAPASQRGGAGVEVAAEVLAVRDETETLPPGVRYRDLLHEEQQARMDLMNAAWAYAIALENAERAPKLQPEYREALARFRAFVPAPTLAPADAGAQS